MKKRFQQVIQMSLYIITLSVTSQIFAVNGAYDFGFSAITRGMAGAGSALPQDSIIAAINPAGMVRVKKQFDFGAALYLPNISYDATTVTPPGTAGAIVVAPGKVNSSVPFFLLPDAGINLPIDDKSSFGVSLYSLGGFGGEFKTSNNANVNGNPLPGPLGNGTLRSDLKQAVTSFTYSRKFLKRSSWGASFLVGLQALKVNGAQNLENVSAHPNYISGKGTDYSVGAGVKFGVLFGILKNLDLSVSYQPKVYMTKLKKYQGLLPDGGDFDIPAFGTIGLAWHIKPNVVLVGDIMEIWFKDVPAYGNSHDATIPGGSCRPGNSDKSSCMGGKNGAGFGWDNAVIYKIGAQWSVTPKTILRAGFNHTSQVLNSNYAVENLITPGALIRNLFTIGATQKISKKDSVNAMLVFIPKQSLRSLNAFSDSARQFVTTSASAFGIGVSWSRVLP